MSVHQATRTVVSTAYGAVAAAWRGRLNAVEADFRGVYSEITAELVVSW